MNFNPKVSIVIPVYNGSNYLCEAIESALAQTYKNTEIIIINDGSNDEGKTESIALSYQNKVRYFAKPNGGVASALNLGIKEMQGDYFSWLSHDDLYYPEKIERQINFLKKLDHSKNIVYSDFSLFSHDITETISYHMKDIRPENFRYWITIENLLHGCTLLIPRQVFDVCGSFDENLRTTQDYDLWFRLAEKFTFIRLPELLVYSRSHNAQGSVIMQGVALIECDKLLTKFIENLRPDELVSATGLKPGKSYSLIAQKMKKKRFKQAEMKAKALAAQNIEKSFFQKFNWKRSDLK